MIAEELMDYLLKHVKGKTYLRITNNRSAYLRLSYGVDGLKRVSVHRAFSAASPYVWSLLVKYINFLGALTKEENSVLRTFMEKYFEEQKEDIDSASLKSVGKVYNLEERICYLEERYFERRFNISLTWWERPVKRIDIPVTLGFYSVQKRLISIRSCLDHKEVPSFFLDFVIYHEMLHDIFPVTVNDGRRTFHSKEFREQEKRFDSYKEACLWEKLYLVDLLKKQKKERKKKSYSCV